MYYANCEWYVDMGEYNKPLCERKSLRPAKCSECPVYIRSIEAENAKLRELCKLYAKAIEEDGCHWCPHYEDVACDPETVPMRGGCGCMLWEELRELGVTND